MKNKLKHIIILLTIFNCLLVNSYAQVSTVTLQPGGSGIDSYGYSATPMSGFHTATTLVISRNASNQRYRSFLMFNLSSIPSDAIITSAKLTLFGTNHSGTNPSYLRVNTSSWAETGVNWNNAPTTTTVAQLALAQSTAATQNYTFDVKSTVQSMVNIPATNYGWTLIKQDESTTGTLTFGSSDNSTVSSRPMLEISYCLPMRILANVTAASTFTTSNGAISLNIYNGVPPFTYNWSGSQTTKDISSQLPGVYSCTVTDNSGNKVKKNIIIGAGNTSLTFTLNTDALSGKDAVIQKGDDGTLVYSTSSNNVLFKSERISANGTWVNSRSLMEFDLSFLPSGASVSSASLCLFGNGHNTTNRSNESYLYPNTAAWNPVTVHWNNQPEHNSASGHTLAATSTTNQNTFVDVTTQVQKWVQNPEGNFGWKLLLADGFTQSATAMAYGSADAKSAGLKPYLIITVSVPIDVESQLNWVMSESYDQNGQVISSSKTYMDDLGRVTQALNKNALGEVFAAQTIYDAYGRPAIQSLPAYAGNTLSYKTNFMLNGSSQEYNYNNFDVSGKITNPDALQNSTINTLGYYYSNNNEMDKWQATSTYPFIRTHYMASPENEIKTTNSAEDAFNATSGREVRNYNMVCGDELKFILGTGNNYKVKMASGNPLSSSSLTFASTSYIKASKSITTSPDNKEVITYSMGDKVIATCMSGLSSPDNCTMTAVRNYMDWYGTQNVDVHIPDANKSSISFPLPTYAYLSVTSTVTSSDISYTITDQRTETVLQSLTDYTINTSTRALTFSSAYLTANSGKPLFLRIRVDYNSTFLNTLIAANSTIPNGIVQYDLDYGHWSVNYYDLAGNMRKEVSAKAINCSSPGTVSMATVYDYSHLGQVVAIQQPDEGLKEFAYNTDGQPRFSQNAEQKLNNRFSYNSYDTQNRVIESGEFSNVSGSGTNGVYFQNYYSAYSAPYSNNISSSTIIDNTDGLYDSYCNDVYHASYDMLNSADDVPSAYTYSASYIGNYKNGKISKTWNDNTTTWYKYDQAGRLYACIKQVKDANYISYAGSGDAQIKTFENAYHPYYGFVTNNYFQKNSVTEYAEHQYTTDAMLRLTNTKFIAGANAAPLNISSLMYDKIGHLNRQVIGANLQGVDYVYTLSGKLKAINHPSLDYTKDRGYDFADYYDANNQNTSTKQDLFGEILEYYPSDYARSNTSIETNTVGLYNGQIYGARYKTRNDVNTTVTGANYIDYLGANQVELITASNYEQQELANRYTYNDFGQLTNSTFGTFNNSTYSFTARNEYKEYGATNNSITYDANGNITRLKRNAYTVSGSTQLLDDLTYNYTANTNKHSSVADAASNSYPSSFNFKNQGGSAGTFTYNTLGQVTASPDENVSSITYYPSGQVKQITFSNNNTTTYYYDDQGKKYKTVLFDNASSVTKYTWYLFNTIYEYISNDPGFNLKQISIGGSSRAGVYKQDNTGLNLYAGHAEYELTDHLGNVRVTFKGTGAYNLEVLSKTDYYAFGGALPGRMWQQSGGDYRYGYQGQEKSQNDVNWEQFELRLYNHDLGRWSAPDPYGQFHSPYLAMANNPVSMVDPDGGYVYGARGRNDPSRAKFYSSTLRAFCQPGGLGFHDATSGAGIVDNEYNGDFGGGGGNGGGSIWSAFSFDQLDAADGKKDGLINGEENNYEYAQSIAPGYNESVHQVVEAQYNALVNSFGTYLSPGVKYDKIMKAYGFFSTEFYMSSINPDKPIYANTDKGLSGGYSIVADSYFYEKWNSIDNGSFFAQGDAGGRKYGGDGSGSFSDNAMKVMDAINEYNPIANLWDVAAYAFTGQDRLGNKMSQGQAYLKAAGVVPVGKVGNVAVKTLQLTGKARTAEQGLLLGERFLGKGYSEIAPGVFRSTDGLRQFRMTNSDLLGRGFNDIPHIHFERYYPFNLNTPYVNWHVPIK